MPATRRMGIVLLMSFATVTSHAETNIAPSPIRRVTTMLQMMQQKVEMEGQKSQALFDRYMCHCRTTLDKLRSDIEVGKGAVSQLQGSIKEQVAQKGGLENDINDAKGEFAEAEKTLQEATSLRTKENKDFSNQNDQMKTDIKALNSAVKGLDKLGDGGGGSFLQTGILASIRRLVATSADLSSSDRDVITTFLSESESDQDGAADDLSQSSPNEIVGILRQMAESMTKENTELNADEKSASKQFESLKNAKESQMSSLKNDMDTKTSRAAQVGLQITEDQGKLDDSSKTLETNTKMEAVLSMQCKTRQQEFDIQTQSRSEEMIAISETMKLLNDNAAGELFRRTMPVQPVAASFLQIRASSSDDIASGKRTAALQTLQGALPSGGERDPRVDFVALALRGRKTSFNKVLHMIDAMVGLLKKEQKDDEDKRSFCRSEIDKSNDEKKDLEQAISDLGKAVEASTQKLKSLRMDFKSKSDSIKFLDEQVADMSNQRKEEHRDYMENLQTNHAAKEILGMAKTRLAKFYDAEAAKAQKAKAELWQSKAKGKMRAVHVVGTALRIKPLPEPAMGNAPLSDKSRASLTALFDSDISEEESLSFTQVHMQTHADGNKVVALISSIIADIEKEVQEMTRSENDAQSQYQQILKDSAEKRAGEAKAIGLLEGYKAEEEAEFHNMKMSVKAKTVEFKGKATYLLDLHKNCDWLLEHFKTRRAARASEIDALQNAKQTLTGADAGFLQVSTRIWRELTPVKKYS